MGTPQFAVPVLQALIDHPQIEVVGAVTAPDRVSSNGLAEPSPIKQLALEKNIAVFQPERIRKNLEFFAQMEVLSIDLMVVAAYGKILPQEILDLPKYGAINIHPSVLPKYRGASPVVGAILAGDKETGVTIIKMTAEMDAGDIIAMIEKVPVQETDTALALIHKLFEEGAALLSKIIIPYVENELTPIPQNENLATYVKLLNKEDGRINWSEDPALIERKIRAYQPWPSAYTTWNGQMVKIIQAEVDNSIQNPSAQIAIINKDLYIGNLKILRLQLAGKKVVTGREFAGSYPQIAGQTVL